jgi:hypothetical protein
MPEGPILARRPPDAARPPAVILVTALRAEARPLIERFGLSRAGDVAGCPYFRATEGRPGNIAGGSSVRAMDGRPSNVARDSSFRAMDERPGNVAPDSSFRAVDGRPSNGAGGSYSRATGGGPGNGGSSFLVTDRHPGNVVPDRDARGARTVALVISGPGRIAAAAAVAAVAATVPDAAWLNLGIAGHADHPLGSSFLAHRVREVASGRAWYPPLVFAPPCPTAGLTTVDTPCEDFPDDDLYDMEGAGFYEVAGRCAPHELVHCLKVVSDNREHPARDLDAARVRELIGDNVALIAAVVEQLAMLAEEQRRLHAEPPGFEEVLTAAHFSVTRQRQLRRALRRWAVLCPDTDPGDWLREQATRSAAEILAAIEEHLDSRPAPLRALGRAAQPRPPGTRSR